MPSYTWVCLACEHTNAPGAEQCQHCGFSASASARQIEDARRMRPTDDTAAGESIGASQSEPSNLSSREEPPVIGAFVMVGLGMFCLFGAFQSFTGGHWPAYMPPQFDLFAVPLSWVSEKLGAYVGGTLAGLVGLGCIVGGLVPAKNRDAA